MIKEILDGIGFLMLMGVILYCACLGSKLPSMHSEEVYQESKL